jgi:hypothetical protein
MASLAAAKRRRAPGQPNTLTNNTPITANPSTPQPGGQLSLQQAISLVGTRINKLESTLSTNMKEVENKFGQQDNYIVENLPDIDAINVAFEDINSRLLSIESNGSVPSTGATASTNISQLSAVKDLIDNLQKHIDTLKTEYNEKFDYVEQAVSSLDNTTKVVFIESNLNKLTSEVNEMKSDLQNGSSDERVVALESRLDNLYEQLCDVNTKIEDNSESKFTELLGRLETLEAKEDPDITDLIEKVAALEARLSDETVEVISNDDIEVPVEVDESS